MSIKKKFGFTATKEVVIIKKQKVTEKLAVFAESKKDALEIVNTSQEHQHDGTLSRIEANNCPEEIISVESSIEITQNK